MENLLQNCLSVMLCIFYYNRGGRLERMNITLQSPQCFALFIFLFGFIGFLQGWRRAVVVMGFTLAAHLSFSAFLKQLILSQVALYSPVLCRLQVPNKYSS